MKVLIWISCLFFASAITTLTTLGAIPVGILYAVTIFIAQQLCKCWDIKKVELADKKEVRISCKSVKNDKEALAELLDTYVKEGKIDKEYSEILCERYSRLNKIRNFQNKLL